MVEAMARNDSAYDGKFYVGVHSTGIYCLPSCKARKPKMENVIFYPTREQRKQKHPGRIGVNENSCQGYRGIFYGIKEQDKSHGNT